MVINVLPPWFTVYITVKYFVVGHSSIVSVSYHIKRSTPCLEKGPKYLVHNFNKFKCIVVIFDRQLHESNAELMSI